MNNFIEDFLESEKKIDVMGDVVIDEYFNVNSERISPEFPIPVYQSDNEEAVNILPGGAANVANQLKKYDKLNNLFCYCNKKNKNILKCLNLTTSKKEVNLIPRKIRLYHNDFPLFRWDIEGENYKSDLEEITLEILEKFKNSNCEFSILSDYNKGFWNSKIEYKNYYINKKTIIDPKKINNYDLWKNCYLIKPNYKEAIDLTNGLTSPFNQINYIKKTLKCKHVVITDSSNSVYYNDKNTNCVYKNNKKVKAKSVIGAGDCFIATLASCLSSDINLTDSIDFSFNACSKYVEKPYNYPINLTDLNFGKLVYNLGIFKNRDFGICFTNGCFDILHEGHLKLFEFCKRTNLKVFVGLNSDESIKKLKGEKRPINNLKNRIKMLESLETIDYIYIFEEETPCNLIKKIKPEILVKGGDYKEEDLYKIYCKYTKEIKIFPFVEGNSTTNMISKIKNI